MSIKMIKNHGEGSCDRIIYHAYARRIPCGYVPTRIRNYAGKLTRTDGND